MEYALTIVERGKKEGAILRDEEGNLVSWPDDKIPSNLRSGDKVFFYISPHRSQTAKDILNEILDAEKEE